MTAKIPAAVEATESAVIRVGDGRGFIVGGAFSRLVVTAAHCLPHLPPAHPASYTEERTYSNFLGPLGEEPTVWAECVFVDPIADLAVLSQPDNQSLFAEADGYEHLVEDRIALRIGRFRVRSPGWSMTLGGQWERCEVSHAGSWLRIECANPDVGVPGTSGSPILMNDGRAVGVISDPPDLNPNLANRLPALLLAEIRGDETPSD